MFILVLGLGVARAVEEGTTVSPEQQITERALARWNALIAGKFADAYVLESPAYRSTVTVAQFQSQFGAAVRWIGATIHSIEVSDTGDRARVKVMLDYQAPDPTGSLYTGHRPIFERWVTSQGEWWHVQD